MVVFWFKFKEKITDQRGNDGIKDVEIMFPLRYQSNFWRTLKCHKSIVTYSLMLTLSVNC